MIIRRQHVAFRAGASTRRGSLFSLAALEYTLAPEVATVTNYTEAP